MIDQNPRANLRIEYLMPQHHGYLVVDLGNIGMVSFACRRSINLAWIGKDILHECLINGLRDARLQKDEEYFEILDDALQERHEEFSLPELTLTELLARYFSTTDQNDLPSWYVLGVVYKTLTNDKQKAKIRESVANHFTRRFDYAYYERACMFDMMKPTSNFTLAYQEIIHEILAKGSKPRPFDWKDFYTDPRLDHFINFCWHFDIPIPNETKDQLASL